ncbi:PREDICTED: ankyrin repeat domain-containing protein SOWAHC [Nanorana parkeri]|uniref:ankyrin repeat domain-containing protein SOWAHC n=1 Tax=Nanorana parkeri TaxID=125878 RepID=UPI000854D0C1|nr:PREDICTED: ankyrin repeat domain-containing protein SOWAHC [Nanorana parkeri]
MSELSRDSVIRFLSGKGGRVPNQQLVEHFRPLLTEQPPGEARNAARHLFKDIVNDVASVRAEDGVKYVCLKKKYRRAAEETKQDPGGNHGSERSRETQPAAGENVGQAIAAEPSTGGPIAAEPSTGETITSEPSTGETIASEPSTGETIAAEPSTGETIASEPSTGETITSEPSTGETITSEPSTGETITSEPSTGEPGEVDTPDSSPGEESPQAVSSPGSDGPPRISVTEEPEDDPRLDGEKMQRKLPSGSPDELLATLLTHARQNRVPVNINARASGGYTPLHLAAMHGHLDVIKLLVGAYDADLDIRDYSGRKAWQYLSPDTARDVQALVGALQGREEEDDGTTPGSGRWRLSKVLPSQLIVHRLSQLPEDEQDGGGRTRPDISRKGSGGSRGKPRLNRIRFRTQIIHTNLTARDDEDERTLKSPIRHRPKSNVFG